MPRIIIDIGPTGDASIEAEGYKGRQCQLDTEKLEKALGRTTSDTKKPEYFQQASQQNKATQ